MNNRQKSSSPHDPLCDGSMSAASNLDGARESASSDLSSQYYEENLDVSEISRLSLLRSIIEDSDDEAAEPDINASKTTFMQQVADAICDEDDEWSRAKAYFITHPKEIKLRRTRVEVDKAQSFLHSYIKSTNLVVGGEMIYQLSNKLELAEYQKRYGNTGQGARSSVKYARDEAGNIYIMKITTQKSVIEGKVFIEANVQTSSTVSRYSIDQRLMMYGNGMKFYTPIKCLGRNLAAYLIQNPSLTVRQQYLLAIKISLVVYQFHQGERAGVPRAHLDLKPDNIVISGDESNNIEVHLVDFESVSEDLMAVTKEREASKVYMPPESVELSNLTCDVFALMRTFYLDEAYYRFQAKEDETKYKRKSEDIYVFKPAEESSQDSANQLLENAKKILSTGQEKTDLKNHLPKNALDLALGLALASSELITAVEMPEVINQFFEKSDLYKQAIVNLILSGFEVNFEYIANIESQLDFQLVIVAVSKINPALLSPENISTIFQDENRFSFLFSLELAQFDANFILSSLDEGLLQKTILLLANAKINNAAAYARVLTQDFNFQWALILLARFDSELINTEIISALLNSHKAPTEFIAEKISEIGQGYLARRSVEKFQSVAIELVLNQFGCDHPVWLELAKDNQEIQIAVEALSRQGSDLFTSSIDSLIANPKLQELIAELGRSGEYIVRADTIIHLVTNSGAILEALNCLEQFGFRYFKFEYVADICLSTNPEIELSRVFGWLVEDMQALRVTRVNISECLIRYAEHADSHAVNLAAKALARQGMFADRHKSLVGYRPYFAKKVFDDLSHDQNNTAKTVLLQTMRVFIRPGIFNSRGSLSFDIGLYFYIAVKLLHLSDDDVSNALRSDRPENGVKTVKQLKRLYKQEKQYKLSEPASTTLARL